EVGPERHDPERMGSDVEQDHLLRLIHEGGSLDRGAERDHLIGMHALARLAAEEIAHRVLDPEHAGHAPDQDNILDLVAIEPRVLERLLADLDAALDEILAERLQRGAREGALEMERLVAAA